MAELKYNETKAKALIAEVRAMRFQSKDPNFLNDGVEVRVWKNIDRKYVDDCVQFLEDYTSAMNSKKQKTVVDPLIDNRARRGLWRGVDIVSREEWNDVDREMQINIYQTLKEGFLDTLDFSESRLGRVDTNLSNDESIADIDNTTADNPQIYFSAIFMACNPQKAYDIIASRESSYTDPVVGGESFTGEYRCIGAAETLQDDGTTMIELFLAQPQYTISEYDMFATTYQRDKYMLFDVPKDNAQSIINAWKLDGANDRVGASASLSNGSRDGLVNIVLSERGDSAQNLTTDNINLACDTYIVMHFAWGYTEDEIDTFLTAHSGSLGAGVSRRVSGPNIRGDGLFDCIIIETSQIYDASKHLFSIALAIGTKIVRTIEAGWNIDKVSLDAKKASYESGARGTSNEFQVTRNNDNCTFDFIGVSTVRTNDEGTTTAGGVGIETEVTVSTGVDPDDTFENVATAEGEMYQDEIVPQEDGLWRRILSKITRKVISANVTTGETKSRDVYYVGRIKKSDFASLSETYADGVTVSFPFVQMGDDGIVTYIKVVTTKTSATKADVIGGSYLFPTTVKEGINADPTTIPATASLTAGQRRSVRYALNELGQAGYTVVETDAVAATTGNMFASPTEAIIEEYAVAIDGSNYIKKLAEWARNQTSAPTLNAVTQKIEQLRITDEGLYDYLVTQLVDVGTAIEFTSYYKYFTQEDKTNFNMKVPIYTTVSGAGGIYQYVSKNQFKSGICVWQRGVVQAQMIEFSASKLEPVTSMPSTLTTLLNGSISADYTEDIESEVTKNGDIWVRTTNGVRKEDWGLGVDVSAYTATKLLYEETQP